MKKMKLHNFLFFLFLYSLGLLFISCVPNIPNTNTQSFSYDYTENGCPTGNQTFRSREEMCDGLKSDTRNNYCAQTLRYQRFQEDCPDRSWF